MRILLGIHRYGADIGGGAETLTRLLAEHLAARDHDVHVITSNAHSYVTWEPAYAPGVEMVNGVTVHRLPVTETRDTDVFGRLYGRTAFGTRPVPLSQEEQWIRRQGPVVEGLGSWLEENAPSMDVAMFVTYLYATTVWGLPVAGRLLPTVLQPTAHDEPPFGMRVFDPVFAAPDAFGFLTPEEESLVWGRGPAKRPSAITGIGIDVDERGDGAAFRRAHGLGDRPLLLYLGRVDPSKGSDELVAFFRAYKQRNPSDLTLVIVGDPVTTFKDQDDLRATGYVSDEMRLNALAAADVFVMPSYFESFSMALCEAWAQERPAMVQGHCDVLAGQARRSGGGLAYRGFAEFETTLDELMASKELRETMGAGGRRFVVDNYGWDVVLDRYEALFDDAIAHFRA